MGGMALHEVLQVHRDVILERWKARVLGRFVPESLPALELVDHFPQFLDEVIEALRALELGPDAAEVEDNTTAAGHGGQRLRLGFSLDAVVHEYDALREVIEDTALDAGIALSFDETRCLTRSMTAGIAAAVTEYARQRDAELCRQHNEHIGFIAHELRNPLATASLALDMLVREGHLSETLRPSRALSRALEEMRSTIDHTLHLARDASGVDVKREHTTLKALLEDTALMAGTDADIFGVGLDVRIEQDGELFVDARLVRSALSNLVRNALKYSHRGGHVEVRGRVTSESVIVEVEDTCGGLEPEEIGQAFAPFVRVDKGTTGFGLGLAIAKQAVEVHAGQIRVQNLPGKGCIFVLELPLATDQRVARVGG